MFLLTTAFGWNENWSYSNRSKIQNWLVSDWKPQVFDKFSHESTRYGFQENNITQKNKDSTNWLKKIFFINLADSYLVIFSVIFFYTILAEPTVSFHVVLKVIFVSLGNIFISSFSLDEKYLSRSLIACMHNYMMIGWQ